MLMQGAGWLVSGWTTLNCCSVSEEDCHVCFVFIIPFARLDFRPQGRDLQCLTECLPVGPGRYLAFQWSFWRLRVGVGLGGLSLADKVIGSE